MRIKLLLDLPLDPAHGLLAGRVLDARPAPGNKFGIMWQVVGDLGEVVGVLGREAEVVELANAPQPEGKQGE